MKRLLQSEIEKIKRSTEEVLENVGVRVMHKELCQRARAAGARVDDATGIVRFPAPLLRELLAQVPSQYQIADLAGNEFTVGGATQGCIGIVTDPWIIDYATQRPRRPNLEDLKRHTIIAQKLDPVVMVSRMDFPVTDIDGPTSSLRALEEHLLHFGKHIFVLPTSLDSFRQWLEIGQILTQDRDLAQSKLFSVAVPVLSPLRLTEMNGEILLGACARDFPIIPTVCSMAGTTGPYNLVGNLLLGNAENLFLAALTQIVKPGQPFLYALGPSRTDMRSGADMYYTLDKVLWKVAAAQMGHSYNMPVSSECGGTMTYRYDQQNGAEGMLFMLAAYESGSAILSGIGSCYNANGMSAEMMVIHAAWLDAARFLNRGIDTEDLDEALESIARVRPGGHYLADDLTLKMLRTDEFFGNELFDHSENCGSHQSLLERAHRKVGALVAGFESPVPGKVQEDLRRYFFDACKRLDQS